MKKIVTLFLAISLVLSLFACGKTATDGKTEATAPENAGATDEKVTIGLNCALTGTSPAEGESAQKAAQLAVDQWNAKGGIQGKQVELIVVDNANESNAAVNAVTQLASNEKILGIIGPQMSSSVSAVSDIIAQYQVPTVVGGTAIKIYDLNNENIFRFRTPDSVCAAAAMAYLIDEMGAKEISMVYTSDDYGVGAAQAAEPVVTDRGMTVTFNEAINHGDMDFTAPLLKLKESGSDGCFIWMHAADLAIFCRQANELGIDIPMIGSATLCNTTFYELVDESVADGLYMVTDFSATDPSEQVQSFVTAFTEKYGAAPDLFAGFYYDGAQVLLNALNNSETLTRDGVRAALQKTDLQLNAGHFYPGETYRNDLCHQLSIAVNEGKAAKVIGYVTDKDIN